VALILHQILSAKLDQAFLDASTLLAFTTGFLDEQRWVMRAGRIQVADNSSPATGARRPHDTATIR